MRKGRRGIWEKSFATSSCCSYQRQGYKIGEKITTKTTDDGCSHITLICTLNNGLPEIEIQSEYNCQKSVTEKLFNATSSNMFSDLGSIKAMLEKVINNSGIDK